MIWRGSVKTNISETPIFYLHAYDEATISISHSASRARSTTLKTNTSYSQSYATGGRFRHCTRQGCKKLAGNKIIGGDCIWGQEYPLINSLIKAVKDEKFTKMIKGLLMSWFLWLLLLFRKSGSETVNEADIKKALAKSQTIFKL